MHFLLLRQRRVLHTLNITPSKTLFFFYKTSNFRVEAERSYIFWRSEDENLLKMLLNLHGILWIT